MLLGFCPVILGFNKRIHIANNHRYALTLAIYTLYLSLLIKSLSTISLV